MVEEDQQNVMAHNFSKCLYHVLVNYAIFLVLAHYSEQTVVVVVVFADDSPFL